MIYFQKNTHFAPWRFRLDRYQFLLNAFKWVKSSKSTSWLNSFTIRGNACQIRERHLQVVSTSGGHLGPGLGVVELTLALYQTLDLDFDKVVWDVGHQGYPHKLITGRFSQFDSLRQQNGVAGYLKRSESKFDHFGAGHASTSISAALGMAIARDRKGENYKCVAVIGDGALTGGMALEAINHAGHIQNRIC